MALPQLQQYVPPPFSRKGSMDVSRILRAAGILAATCLSMHIPGPDTLSSSSHSTCSRETYSSAAVKTRSLPSCNAIQANYGGFFSIGLQYASAAAPDVNGANGGYVPVVPPRISYKQLMANEVVANLAGVPVELMWKDVWEHIFHKTGRQYWLDLIFWMRGYLIHKEPRKVAIMISRELQMYLYEEAPVNDVAWKTVRRLLEQHLREWWVTCPEDPYRVLAAGVWKALIKVYTEFLESALRGSPRLQELDEILFDPELKVISSWTDAAHVNIARGKEEEIVAKLDRLARDRPRTNRRTTEPDLALPLPGADGVDRVHLQDVDPELSRKASSVVRTRTRKTKVSDRKTRTTKSKQT